MTSLKATRAGSLESLVGRVADEFLRRQREGERPSIEEYCQRHPEAASLLRDVLKSLQLFDLSGECEVALIPGEGNEGGTLGDYRLLREVGRGGMGVVYEAEQISLNRRVALKVLPFAATLDPRQLQRFRNEAQAAACLHHGHIVPVFGVGCERGVHYYAMQFIDGLNLGDLTDRLRRGEKDEGGKPLASPPDTETVAALSTQRESGGREYYRTVARWGVEAAGALEHAHSVGIVHRDVKPANLLLDGRGHLWVADFGLARVGTDAGLTMTGDVLGTLRYMSPEQAAGQKVLDHRTDVYSLGVTLYELLALRPAFAATNRADLLRLVLSEEPVSPRRWEPGIPADLETVVLKAMEKDPRDRYASAAELAEDLGRFLADRPIRARRPTLWARTGKWGKRNRPLVGLGLVTLVLGLVGLAASTAVIASFWADAREQRNIAQEQRDEAQRQRDEARQYVYAVDMQRAGEALGRGDLGLVRSLLNRHDPANRLVSEEGLAKEQDLRTFAWYHLNGVLHHQPKESFHPDVGTVWHVDWSPDGRTLALVGEAPDVVLWDLETGEERRRLKGHTSEVNCVTFSPDGKVLVSGGDDRTVRVWDPKTGNEVGVLDQFEIAVRRVLLTPDGKTLAVGERTLDGKRRTTLWDLNTRQRRDAIPDAFPLAFSPTDPLLAILHADRSVRLWSLDTGKECGVLRGHTEPVHCAVFKPRGRSLFTGDGGGKMGCWALKGELKSDKPLYLRAAHRGPISLLTVLPGGYGIVSAGWDGQVRLWEEWIDGHSVVFRGHTERITSIALSPDGKTLASASRDGTVKLWELARTPGRRTLTRGKQEDAFASFAPDGNTIVTAGDGPQVRIWDSRSGALLDRVVVPRAEMVHFAAFTPKGDTVIVLATNGNIYRVDVREGRVTQHWPSLAMARVYNPALSPDGKVLAFEENRRVVRRDLDTGKVRPALETVPEEAHLQLPTFSPDGKLIACVVGENRVVLWEEATGKRYRIFEVEGPRASALAFSPDSRVMAVGGAGRIADGKGRIDLWEVGTGTLKQTLLRHEGEVNRLAFSPDGKTLASSDGYGRIKIWDVATYQELLTLVGHPRSLRSLEFAPDSRRLLSVASRGAEYGWEAYLWDAGVRAK